jgi:hypothetical protein
MPLPSSLRSLFARPLLCLALLSAAVMLLFWVAALCYGTPYLYSDGDTGTWIWLLRHGEAVYGSPLAAGVGATGIDAGPGLPMRLSNYPPLYMHAVAWLAPSDAAILRTGAVLSLLGFLAALLGVGLSAARAGGSRSAGLSAALLLAGSGAAAYNAPSCFPDTAGLGLVVLGVTLAALRVRGWPVLSGLLFCAAVLVKHSLVVLPAATCLWALANPETRRASLLLGVSFVLPLSLALWRLDLFAPLVLWTQAPWTPDYFAVQIAIWGLPLVPGLLVLVSLVLARTRLSPAARAVLGPWLLAALLGAGWLLALGRRGSGANYTIELITALSVLLPIAWTQGIRPRLTLLHAVAMLTVALGLTTYHLGWIWPQQARDQALVQATLDGRPGSVVAETPWYTTRLGRPPLVISYLATQLAHAGRWDASGLLARLKAGQVAAVILNFPVEETPQLGHADRLPQGILPVLRERYQLVAHTRSVFVYAPQPSAPRAQIHPLTAPDQPAEELSSATLR